MIAAIVLTATAVATIFAAVGVHAAGEDEPSIAIRPFGAAPPATGQKLGAQDAWKAAVTADAVGAEPVALAIDAGAGKLYWAEQAGGRIGRANLDGTAAETLLEHIDAPVALAIDSKERRIYWATDGNFPRRIERAALDGSERETLVMGEDLNRPGALVVNVSARRLYWVESVSGRVRRADLDGSSIETVYEERILTSFGLALHTAAERMYWTDLTHAKIQSALLDGGARRDVLDETAGLSVPGGLALDDAAGEIYWADRGAANVRRAKLDGSGVREVVGAAQDVIDPRAVAVDAAHTRIYWSDLAHDEIRSASTDGSAATTVVKLAAGFERTIVAKLPPNVSGEEAVRLGPCRDALESSGRRFARVTYKLITTCLDKMSWVKAVKWRASDPSLAAATCEDALAQFAAGTAPQAAAAELTATLSRACAAGEPATPASTAGAAQGLMDVEIDAAGARCAKDRVKGATVAAWSECVAARYASLVFDAIAARYSRALEWLEEARPFMRAREAAGTRARADGVAGLDVVYSQIESRTPKTAAVGPGYPATGLATAYEADKNDGVDAPVPVRDDGVARAGAPLAFRDNGDGTISDLNTGLMWEKKCDGCGELHDSLVGHPWTGNGREDTIWDWLDDLNAEGGKGFAGYSDWRIPNVKELVSILNYERFNPAVSAAFDNALCGLGCDDVRKPECSCTASGPYWSATTFSDFPAHALMVLFNLGLVGDDEKTMRHFLRAVRGPLR